MALLVHFVPGMPALATDFAAFSLLSGIWYVVLSAICYVVLSAICYVVLSAICDVVLSAICYALCLVLRRAMLLPEQECGCQDRDGDLVGSDGVACAYCPTHTLCRVWY